MTLRSVPRVGPHGAIHDDGMATTPQAEHDGMPCLETYVTESDIARAPFTPPSGQCAAGPDSASEGDSGRSVIHRSEESHLHVPLRCRAESGRPHRHVPLAETQSTRQSVALPALARRTVALGDWYARKGRTQLSMLQDLLHRTRSDRAAEGTGAPTTAHPVLGDGGGPTGAALVGQHGALRLCAAQRVWSDLRPCCSSPAAYAQLRTWSAHDGQVRQVRSTSIALTPLPQGRRQPTLHTRADGGWPLPR